VAQIVNLQDIAPKIETFGEIVSGRTLELRANAGGVLVELSPNFKEGGRVQKGDLLFQTDPVALQAALDLAQAEVSDAQAELNEASTAVTLVQDDLGNAIELAKLRQQALERQQSLRARKVGTEAALETALSAAANADQSVLAKRQAMANANARIERAQINLDRRTINLTEAQRRLDATRTFAPFDGDVSDVSAVQGGLVNANERLGRLIDSSALEVSFRLSSRQVARIEAVTGGLNGAQVLVRFAPNTDPVAANVDRVSAVTAAGETGRQVFAKLTGDVVRSIRPGDFIGVSVTEPVLSRVIEVPATALTQANQVMAIGEDNRIETIDVRVVRNQGDRIILRAGELDGRTIISEISPQLGAGIRVEPRIKGNQTLQAPQMVELSPKQQEQMRQNVMNAGMPDRVKERILKQIDSGKLRQKTYDRLTRQRGG